MPSAPVDLFVSSVVKSGNRVSSRSAGRSDILRFSHSFIVVIYSSQVLELKLKFL